MMGQAKRLALFLLTCGRESALFLTTICLVRRSFQSYGGEGCSCWYIEYTRPAILDIRAAVTIDKRLIAGVNFASEIVGYPIYEICSLNSSASGGCRWDRMNEQSARRTRPGSLPSTRGIVPACSA